MEARELVCTYLHTLQEQGVLTVPVDETARVILRDWMRSARSGNGARSQAASFAAPAPGAPASPPAAASPDSPADGADGAGELTRFIQSMSAVAARPVTAGSSEEELPFFRPPGSTPEEQWAGFDRMLPTWKPLRELGTLRPTVVPGEGSRTASVMFVGDAPVVQDEKLQKPFQGPAGEKLNGMLKAMGLDRRSVYITHLVKFRPGMPRQTLNNRAPSAREIALSLPVLEREVQLVAPRVIVALGVIAARALLRCGEIPLAACQALPEPKEFCGVPVVVTHHPSYLLRTSDLAERRRLWEDMLRVMEIAGLPISAKQRGYFLPKR